MQRNLKSLHDQFSAACLLADDGLHDELPKGSALNAVNTEGYRNDEFKAIHIIADAVVLPDMTAYTLLFQDAILEYSLDSLAHIAAEYMPNWSSPATTLCCMREVSDGQTRRKASRCNHPW